MEPICSSKQKQMLSRLTHRTNNYLSACAQLPIGCFRVRGKFICALGPGNKGGGIGVHVITRIVTVAGPTRAEDMDGTPRTMRTP